MKQYLELLKAIKEQGTYKPAARENMPGTQSLFGYQFKHDLSEGFPLLTTKKMYWKGVVVELIWFLRGDTNIKYLVDNGVNIWNEDAYNYYLKIHKKTINSLPVNDPFVLLCGKPLSFEEFIEGIKKNKLEDLKSFEKFVDYSYGDCGYQYGKVWRDFGGYKDDLKLENIGTIRHEQKGIDQIKNVLNSLRNNPESRRHIVTAVDPVNDNDLALYWCHALFQFNCRPLTIVERSHYAVDNAKMHRNEIMFDSEETGGTLEKQLHDSNIPKYYLDCQIYIRSNDAILGAPFNIASYALLIHVFSKICNFVPGYLVYTIGDAHIYDNHKSAVKEQLLRTPTKLPTLKLSDKENSWTYTRNTYDFKLLDYTDFILENYNPQNKIKAELSTGFVK